MRRVRSDRSYKSRTAEIMQDVFKPWQLQHRDEREGFHRLVGTVVSLSEELEREAEYIENLFFPTYADLSEEYVLYRTLNRRTSGSLRLSGQILSAVLSPAENVDDLVAGTFDLLASGEIGVHTLPVPSGDILDFVAERSDRMYILTRSGIVTYDPKERSVISSGLIDYGDLVVSGDVYLDQDHTVAVLTEEVDQDTFRLYRNGIEIPYQMITEDDFIDAYSAELDFDGNGVIWEPERIRLNEIAGKRIGDYGPDQWPRASWADLNQDGEIGERDVTAVRSVIPSAAPTIKAAFRVGAAYYGTITYVYDRLTSRPQRLYRAGEGRRMLYDDTAMADEYSAVTYDEHTDTYYGIKGQAVEAFKYREEYGERGSIVGRVLLSVPLWNSGCVIHDLDNHNGYLYVLVRSGSDCRVLYADIWQEYVEHLGLSATVELPTGFLPTRLACTIDGHFLLGDSSRVASFRPLRDRYLDVASYVYFNRKHPVTYSGVLETLIPHYVFNSFDSFAFSIGLPRPPGCDNVALRNLILDFYARPQGNNAIGMAYGISRLLGFTNSEVLPSGTFHLLPFTLHTAAGVSINGYPMAVLGSGPASGDLYLSGYPGRFRIVEGQAIVPDVTSIQGGEYLIEGYAYDAYGYPVPASCIVEAKRALTSHPITVTTYANRSFLRASGLLTSSGECTTALRSLVTSLEETAPFTAANIVVNETVIHPVDFPQDPVVPTLFGPKSGELMILSGDLEVTL